MEKALQVFNFQEQQVRIVIIDGEIWFIASDVCRMVGIVNVSDAISKLDEDEKLISSLPISGQNRQVLLVNESGLYHLIFQSRKEQAQQFRKWTTNEVLPAIRKTGSYSLSAQQQPIVRRVYPWTEDAECLRQINMKTIQPGFFTNASFVLQKLIYVDLGTMTPDERAKIDISFGKFFPRWLRGDRSGQLKGCTVSPRHPYDPSLIQQIGQVVDSETRRKYPVYHYSNIYAGDRDTFWDLWYAPVILPVYFKGKLPDGLPRMIMQEPELPALDAPSQPFLPYLEA